MAMMASSFAASALPLKTIPGSYGPPVIGPLKDRLDYFWFQGPETFFRHRATNHKSTVFRTNIPPTFPFFRRVDPRVIAVVDCAAFRALFDLTLVEKKDVLVGDFMPSTSFTGDMRVVVYMDPSEQKHAAGKGFCLDLLKRSAGLWESEFLSSADVMLTVIERDLTASSSGSAGFLQPLQKCLFAFLCKSIARTDPAASPEVGECGFLMLDKWLSLQLLPTVSIGVLQPLEEIFLHSFAYPFALVKGDYQKLYSFMDKEAQEVIRIAGEGFGLTKEEAIHNILFVLGFNAFGGFSVFLPGLITTLGRDKTGLQDRLRAEVRGVLAGGRALGFETVREMELVRSTVQEVLRLNPPVYLQFGRARRDFVLNSHETAYQVMKGELLCGYQTLAMRDPMVFDDPEAFVADRFVGEKGRRLLDYLYWSNGPETGQPTTANKQCAAKDYVVATACMLVAEIVRRYDDFRCDDSALSITKLEKAKEGTEAQAASVEAGRPGSR
ncbi:hypothetical protein Taro_023157 [Colocasia esculenta]|uniref:Uncharacterized protein n=1 Tax=Colocasia esculenta TaxID=4460 RepID=A0A843VGK1_COLES|nr:hypothetical protein [Colocasia esculenta]